MVHGTQTIEVMLWNGDRLGVKFELDITVAVSPAQQPPPRMYITFRDYLIIHGDIPTLIEILGLRI